MIEAAGAVRARPAREDEFLYCSRCLRFVCSLGNGANRLKGPPACEKRQDGADEQVGQREICNGDAGYFIKEIVTQFPQYDQSG